MSGPRRVMTARPAGDYGAAPWVPWTWLVFAVVYLVLAVINPAGWFTVLMVGLTLLFVGFAALYWYAALRGQFEVWAELLTVRPPPARLLDVGSGSGAVAIMAALRYSALQAVGFQPSGDPGVLDQARTNAEANRVADRIRFDAGDLTDLPYPDASFDLVTAN